MRIENLSKADDGNFTRVSATVIWENCDRPAHEVFFETEAGFGDDLQANPNAFVLALFVPAMRHGERRLWIEGKVCPQLRNGVETTQGLLRHWYGEARHTRVAIEPQHGFEPPMPRRGHTASFMSGGVDALATLRCNRNDFPIGHPGSVRDCFYVHGFDVGGYAELHDNRASSAHAVASLRRFAERVGVHLIPVRTNLRHIDDNDALFADEWHGAALAAVAHAFAGRVARVLIPSSHHVSDLTPWGSHPILETHYGSADLDVWHDGLRLARREKVGIVAGWQDGLDTLRSCFDAFRPAEMLNCGRCEKCLRTMTGLLVCGKLRDCPTYPYDDLTPELLDILQPNGLRGGRGDKLDAARSAYVSLAQGTVEYWAELVEPLRRIGREDLVQVIERKLKQFESGRTRGGLARRMLKEFDRAFLNGALAASSRRRRAARSRDSAQR